MPNPRAYATLPLLFVTACASSSAFSPSPHYATVTKHLDVGGHVLLYTDIENDLDTGATQLDAMLERASKTYPDLDVARINTRRILRQLGLDQVVALGLSSSKDGKAFHNRMFLEYGKERRGLLLMTGAPAHAMETPSQAPADADLVFESDLKVKSLVDLVEVIVKTFVQEKGLGDRNPFAELDEKLPGTALTIRQVIDRLDTRLVGVLRVDETRSFVWPADQRTKVPGFDVLLALDDMAVLFDAYAGLMRNLPNVTSSSDGDMQWLELDVGMAQAPWLRPVFAKNTKTGRIFVGTSKSFAKEYLADKKATGRTLAQSSDWKRATSRFLPKANGVSFMSGSFLGKVARFARTVAKDDKQAQAGVDLVLDLLPEPGIPFAAQQVSMPDGLYHASYASSSHKSTLFPALLAGPVALAGMVAAVATSGLREYLRASKDADDEADAPTLSDEQENETEGGEAWGLPNQDEVERYRIPLAGPSRGAARPTVWIVEFSDFQCPFCSRVNPTLKQLFDRYPNDVRLYFRHNPLSFHIDAPLAAQAATAAGAQGKFWVMHDKLFANQSSLKRADLEGYAKSIGLDVQRFARDLDRQTYKQAVEADVEFASKAGVGGTPSFFINGRPLTGAQPIEKFTEIIDQEISKAKLLEKAGTPRAKLYDKLMATAEEPKPKRDTTSPPEELTDDVYKLPLGDSPGRGGRAPKVTVVEFADFQCPFCKRARATLDALAETYGKDLRLVFKHEPLSFHKQAMPAALAAEAARAQGKFWAMHDKLFESQGDLSDEALERYADEIGLDMARYRSSLRKDKRLRRRIESDQAQATLFGATGTPTFFVNGRPLRGARGLDTFKSLVDEEIAKADAMLDKGIPRGRLYLALTKKGLTRAKPEIRPGTADPEKSYRVDVAGAPVRGAKNALVTIVMFSDYECPYCRRVEPTLARILKEYKRDVRVVWRDMPLSFHHYAKDAALAARAAGKQGKFWEMHDKLVDEAGTDGPAKLTETDLEKYAQELGLAMESFAEARKSAGLASAIEADRAMAEKLGVTGTPTFFINGKILSGAQPFDAFKKKIDEELKAARKLVARGTPRAKVYDAIMRKAEAQVEKRR